MGMSITQKILDMLAMQGELHAFSNKYGISIKKESETVGWLVEDISDSCFMINTNGEDNAIDICRLLRKVRGRNKILWAKIPHEKEVSMITKTLSIEFSTGIHSSHSGHPAMLFVMRSDDIVMGKAFCKYCHDGIGKFGPTIEFFEIAKEWTGKGYGTLLMNWVIKKFHDQFDPFYCANSEQLMYVDDVQKNACGRFLKFGFESIYPPSNEDLCRHIFKEPTRKRKLTLETRYKNVPPL